LLKVAHDPADAAPLRQEYELMLTLQGPGVARPAQLVESPEGPAMVLGPAGLAPLAGALNDAWDWQAATRLVLTLAQGLAALHAAGLVHRDLRPGNLLIDRPAHTLLIADLLAAGAAGSALPTGPGSADAGASDSGEPWAYLSPEQTGRTGRPVDARSDLYAVGMLLYRLLAGRLPFQGRDPLEWVHCQLARLPASPVEHAPAVPRVLGDIVLKLLAKAPEDRYQSAHGLQVDLERCLRRADASGQVAPFPLGSDDIAGRLEFPRKLYGREAQAAALSEALDTVVATRRSRLVLLAGAPGVGKTTLVQHLRERVLAAGGSYAVGKYDQEQRDVPYSALTQALDEQVRQRLAGSEAEVEAWRRRFVDALGLNTGLAARLVPALAILLGHTGSSVEVDAPEAQRRLHLVLRQTVGVIASVGPPLLLFLDDLHAADPGSLSLLHELLADPQLGSMLVIGACRAADGELPPPVASLVDGLRPEHGPLLRIDLQPLGSTDVARLLAATLRRDAAAVEQLAGLVFEKTGGNPFFAIEFLRELQAEGLLWFDAARGAWQWDLERIAAKGYSGNVVELMVRRLQRLAPQAQHLLRQAACLGSVTDSGLLAALSGHTPGQIAEALGEAVQASLVQPLDSSLRFAHDRVREAAYELTPEHERAAMHLQAGRLLLERLSPAELEERLFDVAHQFNRGADLLQGDEVGLVWALNARAGRKAKAASAFASARIYLLHALKLQPPDAWVTTDEQAYEQAFDLALELAECESVAGDAEVGEQVLDMALQHARSDAHRVRVHRMRSRLQLFCSRYGQALTSALEALRLLGFEFPEDDARLQAVLQAERAALERAVAGRRAAELLELRPMTEPSRRAAMVLLVNAFFPARNSRPSLFPLLVVRAVTLSLQYGNTVQSCQAYALYPRLLRREGRLDEAYDFSLLSLQLAQRLGATGLRGSLLFSHLASSYFLRQPYASGMPLLNEGFTTSLQVGSLYDASGCALIVEEYLLESGAPLEQMVKAADSYAPSLGSVQAGLWPLMLRSWGQFARALQGRTGAPDSLDGEGFSEAAYEAAMEASNAVALKAVYLVLKQVAACMAGRHERAMQLAREAEHVLKPLAGMAIEITHRHYRMLSSAALCPRDTPPPDLVAWLQAEHEAMRPLADACAHNFQHRRLLIGAELARIEGRELDAERLYEQSIAAAHRCGFVHHEAQAFERTAAFHRERGQPRMAVACLREARRCYQSWGAGAKVRELDAADPLPAPKAGGAESLDVLAVAKASQALSSLIDLDELIDALMRIALDHAGAQSALLCLVEGDVLRPAALAAVQGSQVRVDLHATSPGEGSWPAAVVNYVRRTREQVLIEDAASAHAFSADPYMQREHPRSVMCLPLQRRSDLVGVLYLEHRLSSHAFTEGRVALLQVLASQAAISLETARLYAALKAENAERRRAEQAALERQSRLQRLVESSLVGVRFADMEGRILDANDAFLQIAGYTRADLAAGGLTRQRLTPPEYREADARATEQLLRGGRYAPYEKEYVRKDGTRVPVMVSGILFEGEPRQSVAFVLDLTERRRAEAEQAARVAAEEASQAKSAFLASMSHELRTPLNGILGYAQLLQLKPALPERERRGLATIEASGRHLLALINDILDLARIEAGRLELSGDTVRLRRLVEVVADTVRPTAQHKGLAFSVDLAGDLPHAVQADERRLSQVLLNILGNAVKFTDRGAVILRVFSRADDARSVRLTLDVEDTGIGMSSDELQRIFRPFEQAGATRRRAEGTGLGLAITDALVREMGGRLTVRSQPGKGSVFSVELALPVLERTAGDAPRASIAGYSGPRRRVLIADDVPESRALLTDLLGSLGFQTFEAANGLQALEQAQAIRPDLILMDNGMPVMTGVDATKRLRTDTALAGVPVIAVSAGASEAERLRCLEAGASAFLPKPVDVQELLHTIGRVLALGWLSPGDVPLSPGGA
jgi:PAS domain S-box-containing protein